MDNHPWRYKAFFSVDLENSTAYKSSQFEACRDYEWCITFDEFFTSFPEIFNQKQQFDSPLTPSDIQTRSIEIWKILGDEILFHVDIVDTRALLIHTNAFKEAINEYNISLAQKELPLRCKGTVWTAGFPINNIEIKFGSASNQLNSIDFIGSSIDAGFRLTKHSSPRKLIISVETAYILAHAKNAFQMKADFKIDPCKIKYGGRHVLGGIFHNKPYPVFWIDLGGALPHEDKWIGIDEFCDSNDLINFAEELFNSSKLISRPFIESDCSGMLSEVPERMKTRKSEKIAELLKLKNKTQVFENEIETGNELEDDIVTRGVESLNQIKAGG